MLNVTHHNRFKDYYDNLTAAQKKKFAVRLDLFCKDPRNKILQNHRLKGDLHDFYAFSVGGDLRVIYVWKDKETIELYKIGKHTQIY